MRTHTYWITYEEYLAYGGVPPSTPYEVQSHIVELRGGNPVCKTNFYQSGLRGGNPVSVSCSHQVHRLICILII